MAAAVARQGGFGGALKQSQRKLSGALRKTQTDRSLLPVTAFDIAAMRQAIASIRDVVVEGTARTGQCPAHGYRFHRSGRLPGASADGDLRAWHCDDSGRPARLEATDTRSAEHLIVDFDWSRRVDIRAPRD